MTRFGRELRSTLLGAARSNQDENWTTIPINVLYRAGKSIQMTELVEKYDNLKRSYWRNKSEALVELYTTIRSYVIYILRGMFEKHEKIHAFFYKIKL